MKHQKKLQLIFFILAAIIFCGRELLHPFFHAHQKIVSYGYQYQSGTLKIENESNSKHKLFLKSTCPICSSIADKSTAMLNPETPLIKRVFPGYSHSCELVSFNFRIRTLSRAPPVIH